MSSATSDYDFERHKCNICGHDFCDDNKWDGERKCPVCEHTLTAKDLIGDDDDYAWCE